MSPPRLLSELSGHATSYGTPQRAGRGYRTPRGDRSHSDPTPIRTGLRRRRFAQVIARVPGLTLLNGSTVDARERRDCELHYLRGLLAQAEERPAQLQVPPPPRCNCVHGRARGPRHHLFAGAHRGTQAAGSASCIRAVGPLLCAWVCRRALLQTATICPPHAGAGSQARAAGVAAPEVRRHGRHAGDEGGQAGRHAAHGGQHADAAPGPWRRRFGGCEAQPTRTRWHGWRCPDALSDPCLCCVSQRECSARSVWPSRHRCDAVGRCGAGCITLKSLKYILSRLHDVPMPWQHVSVRSPATTDVRSLDAEDDAQTLTELAIEVHPHSRVDTSEAHVGCDVIHFALLHCSSVFDSGTRVAHAYMQDDSEVQVQLQPPGEPPEFIKTIQRQMVPPQSVHWSAALKVATASPSSSFKQLLGPATRLGVALLDLLCSVISCNANWHGRLKSEGAEWELSLQALDCVLAARHQKLDQPAPHLASAGIQTGCWPESRRRCPAAAPAARTCLWRWVGMFPSSNAARRACGVDRLTYPVWRSYRPILFACCLSQLQDLNGGCTSRH